ncbi:hypothetical protein ACFXGT_36455 [Streptomyces sp. NPDC059352]|uniref:hypothetical protein n=1 Tax=Streptomyces sp. NPDC059352 TaxID=3346810 RepID=UPI00368ADAB1
MEPLEDLSAAVAELKKAEEVVDAKRAALHATIAEISRRKVTTQAEITRVTGYSRETVRRITRAAEAGE